MLLFMYLRIASLRDAAQRMACRPCTSGPAQLGFEQICFAILMLEPIISQSCLRLSITGIEEANVDGLGWVRSFTHVWRKLD